MDGYMIAFGIQNMSHIEKVLSEAYRWARIILIFH
jgi:ubiquinone/menaquinone biosynthesis C-methylase UbiE